ncbi:motility associated factor glycosyltransferase family protein [Thalassotalea euphylliae]|nr:6-hydroxymethylpterin diphosphokinase MptE-like protein [Thalassotalea euphylliae]
MNAFKVFDRNIYEFFSDYQPSRYLVDIVDGFPNILDTEKNKYFYEYPAYLMANVQLARHQKSPESASALFDVEDKNEAGFMHSDALNQILQVLWRRMEKNDGQVRELSKVVNAAMVFGIGCGYHLELLCSQHKIKNLYVIEPELDLFYASLFTANWQHILNKVDQFGLNIHISLGEQEDDFFEHILKQSRHYGRYEIAKTFGFIHYHNEKTEALVDQYKSRFDEAIRGWGFFDDAVMAVSHMLTSLQQGVPLLKKKQITDNLFADYPVFIIGNGPSLDGLIELIKRYQHQAIIISCGSALSALYQYGITPDIHCEQERTSPVAEQLDYYCSPETLEQIILFGPSTLHPDVYAKFPVKVMAAKGAEPTAPLLMESRLAELFEIHSHINPTVANTAASVAVGFGFKNIYFLGVDLGHKKGSSHHSKKSIYYGNDGEDMELYDASSVLEQERKGNFGGVFYTNPFFDSSKRALERLTAENSELNFYNLSDGVLIQGAKPIAPDLLTFHHDAIDNKQSKLRELVKTCSYQDSGKLFNELSNNLDFAGFEDLCLALVRTIDELNYHFEDCLDLIKRHYLMLIDEKICLRDHFYYLLEGSMMHIQAMLTRILYEAVDEGDAIEDFREALSSYREFLLDAISYYKKNALTPLYHESSWFDVIINSDSKNN